MSPEPQSLLCFHISPRPPLQPEAPRKPRAGPSVCIMNSLRRSLPSLRPLRLFSVHLVPAWGARINSVPPAPSAAVAVPRCPRASFCLLKGTLAETQWLGAGTGAPSSFLGGSGGRRRSVERGRLPTAACRAGNRDPPRTELYT